MKAKTTILKNILKVLAGIALIPVLALLFVMMTPPESTKAA